MNRALNTINFFGVLALVVLCVMQWSRLHAADGRIQDLDAIRSRQAAQIDNQTTQLRQNASDLAEFRERIAKADLALADTEKKRTAATSQLASVTRDRDQLKASLQTWQAAVAERDAAIRSLNLQVQTLVLEREAAIAKYNDLVNTRPTTAEAR